MSSETAAQPTAKMTLAVAREQFRARTELLRIAAARSEADDLWDVIDAGIAESIENDDDCFQSDDIPNFKLLDATIAEYRNRGFTVCLRGNFTGHSYTTDKIINIYGWDVKEKDYDY